MDKVDIANIKPIPKPQIKVIPIFGLDDENEELKQSKRKTFINLIKDIWFSDFASAVFYIILRSASIICFALAFYFGCGGRF